jgi:succinate-acetate transporter protein
MTLSIMELRSFLPGPQRAGPAGDDAGVLLLAAFLFFGGCLQFLAAILGIRRTGEFRSTIGRQLASVFGKRGTIVFWLVLGTILVAGGLAVGVPVLLR